ncbi:MAG: ArsA family ATPase [Thermoleophilaceae bacterium]|nr:ArsA family ATPase [Thermoleophilaceae bacterium]
MSVAELIERKSVVVCAGAGGVGKTTSAAAIALGMAERGLKTAVLTIDPAKRLANSLGLEQLDNEPRRVALDANGELWAMMLDAKSTFDGVVERYASSPESRDRILENRIYHQLSNAVAGSQEYMAMEKLYELHESGEYDLLVLDTPPTRNALDFLDAPERLHRFVDSRSLAFFMAPSRTGLKIFSRGTGLLFAALKRVTGVDLLQDISEFFGLFAEISDGFRERSRAVTQLLENPATTFLLVTSPQRDAIDEVIYFRRSLRERKMPFGGVIVNRVHQEVALEAEGEDVAEELASLLEPKLARRAALNFDDYRAISEQDRRNMERLEAELGSRDPLVLVPYFDEDVHDLSGLERMNEHLFAPDAAQTAA